MRTIYHEGRCGQCGQRVTVERAARYHQRSDGQACGPVETHQPGQAPDTQTGVHWTRPKADDGTSS